MTTLIFHLTNRGFYSEINNLISAHIYARKKGYSLRIMSEGSMLYFSKGFYRYFKPASTSPLDLSSATDELIEAKGAGCKVFKQIRRGPYSFQEKQRVATEILTLTEPVLQEIQRKFKALNLPEHYTAFHIRRGDKVGEKRALSTKRGKYESKRYSVLDYLAALETSKNISLNDIENVFLMTDDYKAIEEFRAYLSNKEITIQIYTMCKPESEGHSTLERMKEKNYFTEEEVIDLLTETEIVRKSDYFLGSFKSNLPRYVKLVHKCPENCVSVDVPWHPR